jgi:hypothetical protein
VTRATTYIPRRYRTGPIIEALIAEPSSGRNLAARLGVSRDLLAEILRNLASSGLVHLDAGGAWRAGPAPGNPGRIPADWVRVLLELGGDLPAGEWAHRIGCRIADVEAVLSWARQAEAA